MTEPLAWSWLDEPILIVGGYGYRNVGDEGMLAGLLQTLGGRRVTVVSRLPAETSALHGVSATSFWRALSELRGHRTVLIGGGSLFGRDMGQLGRLLPAYGLFARLAGRRIVVRGISLDADLPTPTRQLVRMLLSGATPVGVRDEASARVVRSWRLEAAVEPDLSANIAAAPASVGQALLESSGVDLRRPIVGLSLTAVNASLGRRVARAIIGAARQLSSFELCVIPMSQHPFVASHNDLIFARALRTASPNLKVLEGFHHPAAMLSAFGSLAAAVCMRYHSLLFAERMGIPIIAISYAPKSDAWLAERGLPSHPPKANVLSAAIARALEASSLAS